MNSAVDIDDVLRGKCKMSGRDRFDCTADVGRLAPTLLRNDPVGQSSSYFSFTPDVMSVAMMPGRSSMT